MSAINILCSDPNHANNSASPGWNNGALGTADRVVTGMICQGCVNVNAAAVVPNMRVAATANINGNVTPDYMLMRAIVLSVVGEFNTILAWLASFKAAAAAATSLATLQQQIAALPATPNITNAQVLAAIASNLSSGSADS
jgi:hypothetical protein